MSSLYDGDFVNDVVILSVKNRYRLSDGVMTTTTMKVEKQKKVTMYSSAEQMDVIMTLEPAALKLWLFLSLTLPKGKVSVKLRRKHFMSVSGISSATTIRNAIAQLVRYDLVRLQDKDVFHLNPLYVCSGNRVSMYKNSVNVTADLT